MISEPAADVVVRIRTAIVEVRIEHSGVRTIVPVATADQTPFGSFPYLFRDAI